VGGQHQVPAGASHLGVSTRRDQVEGGTGTCAGTMEWADNLRKGEVNSICSHLAHRRAVEAKLVPGSNYSAPVCQFVLLGHLSKDTWVN